MNDRKPDPGSALLGMYGGIRCAIKNGFDPAMIYHLAFAQAVANMTDDEWEQAKRVLLKSKPAKDQRP